MKSGAKTAAWVLLGILTLPVLNGRAVSAADDTVYRAIAERNIFELQPVPPPVAPPAPVAPKPNVKLVGIVKITARPQVVIWSQEPGVPPKPPVTMVLLAGQRKDNIEVAEIDPVAKTARVKIDTDELTLHLEDKPMSSPSSPVQVTAGPGGIKRPGMPGAGATTPTPTAPGLMRRPPGGAPGAYNPMPAVPGAQNGYFPQGAGIGTTAAAASMGLPARAVRTADDSQQQLSPEQQMILIEAQRDAALRTGDTISQILPPTPLGALMQQQAGGASSQASPLPPVPGRR